jgi:hypothetical protein
MLKSRWVLELRKSQAPQVFKFQIPKHKYQTNHNDQNHKQDDLEKLRFESCLEFESLEIEIDLQCGA